ncbi:phenylacetaldehyde oxime monooxygenase CYP71AN24-like [Gastrolobium bilobum]|uniref:phenylacetaldehyde oxime monooxygenase CYP71AN24-like n=1 Tax=Gastrolobium bilobum TaxID=150636 RepID=UPI002AB0FFD2|nr:phenylacetaldehyde oxime monooxygenase CYP71AN24-like [Gastrolobium bilobum]
MALFLKQVPYDLINANLFVFLSCFISMLLVFKLTRRSKSNLPPSPPKLPIIGNYHQLGTLPHRSFQALSQKYGPLLLLQLGQLPVLVVSSVEFAREVMKTHDVVFASRPHLTATKVLLYGCKDVAFASYGETWRQKRKLCVLELLSMKRVQSVQFIREEEVAVLVSKIHKACNNGCSVNLSEMLITTANNIICRCIFGRKYDEEDGSVNYRLRELMRRTMIQVSDFNLGDMFPLLGWIDSLTGQIKKYKATFDAFDAFFDHIIAERKTARRDSEKKDFLDILLQLEEDGMPEFELTQDDLKALILDMFLGGTDTTSTTIEWTIAELVKNPVTMKKAQEEVRRVVGNNPKLEDNDVNQMEYVKCVVKETLRLHPVAPLLAPRETTSSVKLGGYDIPDRTMVYVNAWAIQRDPRFWEMPEEFLPERFENSEVNFNGQDFQFIPFGSGRRKCPGMTFGLASAEYMLANLLYWFDWKLPRDGATVQELDMSEKYGLTVNKKVPLYLEPMPYFNL